MTNSKQLQMVMRDMLFVTWAVQPERARKLIGERLELDTKTDSTGREVAFASAVCFSVAEVRSSVLPIGHLSFEQVNYRIYVKAGDVPAVCFLDMKMNSRMVATLTSFLRVPIHYEEIEINTAGTDAGAVHYTINSAGVRAEAITAEPGEELSSIVNLTPGFITDRLVGYVLAGDGMFKIDVEQPGLDSVSARVVRAEAPRLEQLGLLNSEESTRPHSALYVREASFGANMPTRES
jgi:uncharacterized protein YqjF (DUF2071 family)